MANTTHVMSARRVGRSGPEAVRSRRGALRTLWAAGALGGLAQSLAGTAGALLARDVAGSDAAAGLPQALLVIGAAVSALVMSAATRRRGRRVALSLGAGVAVVGCVVVALAGVSANLPWVLVGSLLLGSGNTAVMLGRYAAADLGGEALRARAMASVLVATTIGAAAGPNLLAPAGWLASAARLPALVGPYLVAAAAFAAAATVLAIGLPSARIGPASPAGVDVAGREDSEPIRRGRPVLGRRGAAGLAVLSLANLVMVSVMTVAPVQLHHVGLGLGAIGLVVSVHIAGMFAPSPVSGRLADRFGAPRVAAGAAVTLTAASVLAAGGAASSVVLGVALAVLGVGWNLALVAGSLLLTAGVPAIDRPRREGWGEVGMGAAASGGGAASGVVMVAGGYPVLAAAAAAVAALLLPWVWRGVVRNPSA